MKESYSSIQDYQRCPKKYEWRNVVHIQPRRRNSAFFWGSEAHGMFQNFCIDIQTGWDQHVALNRLEDYIAARCAEVDDDLLLFEDEKITATQMIEEAAAMVRRYLTKYHDETWEILHVEEQFTYETTEGTVVTFTPDLVIRDRNGNVWIVDWKTTKGSVPNIPDIPFDDLQALTYAAGVKPMYPELKGFIFIRLRKKTPSQPRLNTRKSKDGWIWVNNLKALDTTYEILYEFLESEAPDLLKHKAHALRLAELRTAERYHWRETIIVTDTMITEAAVQLDIAAGHMSMSAETGDYYRVYSPNPFDGCARCPYHSLCRSDLVGWDTGAIIEEEYEPRDMSYKEYETEEEPF